VATKVLGLFPIIGVFRQRRDERWYYTLLMSTGLTFGTISALFGLSHQIVTPEKYSYLVAVVIGSAVVPTLIANAFFLPRHLLPATAANGEALSQGSQPHRWNRQNPLRRVERGEKGLVVSKVADALCSNTPTRPERSSTIRRIHLALVAARRNGSCQLLCDV